MHLADVGGTPQVNTHFGAAVALSGNNLLVGCPGCGTGWHGVMLDLADPMGGLAPFPIALLGAEEEVSDPELGAGAAVAFKANVIAIGSALAQPFGASGQIGVVDVGHLGISGVVWDHSFSGEQAGSHFGSALALEVIDTHGTIRRVRPISPSALPPTSTAARFRSPAVRIFTATLSALFGITCRSSPIRSPDQWGQSHRSVFQKTQNQ